MDFLTREIFDALILGTILIGLSLAAVRLYRDFTRPLPRRPRPHVSANPDEQRTVQPPRE